MERKSFELHVQSANWVGGIAAAAAGGVLLALMNENTPASLVIWLRILGGVLLVALGASAYTQLHSLSVLSALEKSDEAGLPADKKEAWLKVAGDRQGNSQFSQTTMVYSLLVAALVLFLGLIFFKPNTKPAPEWAVADTTSGHGGDVIVLTKADTGAVRIVSRRMGEEAWHVSEVAVAGDVSPAPAQQPASPPPPPK